MKKLIVYEGGGEVFVLRPSDETTFLEQWFRKGGRDVDEYTRTEIKGVLEITSEIHACQG